MSSTAFAQCDSGPWVLARAMVGPSKLWEATSRETRSAKAGQNLARLAGKHYETLEYIKAIRRPWWVFTTVLQSPKKKNTTAPPQILLDLSISILDVSTMCPPARSSEAASLQLGGNDLVNSAHRSLLGR